MLKLELESGTIVDALVDSGASTNFVAAEVVEDIPKRNCGDYVVTGAFPGNRSFNQLVSLGFGITASIQRALCGSKKF